MPSAANIGYEGIKKITAFKTNKDALTSGSLLF